MTATLDTGATRSFISEDCVRRWAIQWEAQIVQTRIRLADGSTLEVGRLLRVDVGMAGKVVKFISPNIVRLAREGERKRRVANVMQLKPFYQEEEGEDEEFRPQEASETRPAGTRVAGGTLVRIPCPAPRPRCFTSF
ncbi:hypothetical protein ACLKA6_007785, partial [Drosophila palustris]